MLATRSIRVWRDGMLTTGLLRLRVWSRRGGGWGIMCVWPLGKGMEDGGWGQ